MIKGKTSSGFSFEVDPDVVKDYEYLELAAGSSENGLLFSKLVVYTLGKDQKDALVKHLKDKKGRAWTEDVAAEYAEIVSSIAEGDPEAKK